MIKIKDIWIDVTYWFKSQYSKIYNLIRWFPIIWKDRDYDQGYIYDILEFKLKNQAKYIGDKDRHVSAKRDAEIMMTCSRLINKVKTEYYEMESHDYYDSEFIFKPIEGSDYSKLEIIEKSEHYDDYFKKYPLIYKQIIKEHGLNLSKSEIAFKMSRINHKRAIKLLFNIMKNNIEQWWD